MIEAVIFDYGGVITSGGAGDEPAERFAKLSGVEIAEADTLIWGNWPNFVRGKIDEDGYWTAVEAELGRNIPVKQRRIWNMWDSMVPRPEMVSFVQELKDDGLRVGLLSNVAPPTAKVTQSNGAYSLFSRCLLSCEIGYAKPDPEIYQVLLGELAGVKPEQIVFVDDQENMLFPARELGIKTILAINAEQIITDVKSLLKQ